MYLLNLGVKGFSPFVLFQNKENSGQTSESVPQRCGPKVNGVRRALVSKQKPLPSEGKVEEQNDFQTNASNGGKSGPVHVQLSEPGEALQGNRCYKHPHSGTQVLAVPSLVIVSSGPGSLKPDQPNRGLSRNVPANFFFNEMDSLPKCLHCKVENQTNGTSFSSF